MAKPTSHSLASSGKKLEKQLKHLEDIVTSMHQSSKYASPNRFGGFCPRPTWAMATAAYFDPNATKQCQLSRFQPKPRMTRSKAGSMPQPKSEDCSRIAFTMSLVFPPATCAYAAYAQVTFRKAVDCKNLPAASKTDSKLQPREKNMGIQNRLPSGPSIAPTNVPNQAPPLHFIADYVYASSFLELNLRNMTCALGPQSARAAPRTLMVNCTGEECRGRPCKSQRCGFISGLLCPFLFWDVCFSSFSSGPVKCRILQHFLTKLTYFTLGADLFWDFFSFCFGMFFRFSSGPAKCLFLQHFLAKLTHFTLARQHPQHRFQHPPHVRPTSLASPTNRG